MQHTFLPETLSPSSIKQFCRNCGKEVLSGAFACISCGLPPTKGKTFCNSCGSSTNPEAVVCIKCGIKLGSSLYLPGGQPNSPIMTPAFWGAVMVFIGFFLPWHKYYKFTGIQLAIPSGGVMGWMIIAVDLILLPTIIFIISVVTRKVPRLAKGIRYVPLAILILITILFSSQSYSYDSDGKNRGFLDAFFQEVGFGFILVIIGSIMMCFYNPKKE